MQHAQRMRHIVICGLLRSTIFFQIIPQKAGFKKKNIKRVFRFSLQFCLQRFSF
jgi:hypothetical protein